LAGRIKIRLKFDQSRAKFTWDQFSLFCLVGFQISIWCGLNGVWKVTRLNFSPILDDETEVYSVSQSRSGRVERQVKAASFVKEGSGFPREHAPRSSACCNRLHRVPRTRTRGIAPDIHVYVPIVHFTGTSEELHPFLASPRFASK